MWISSKPFANLSLQKLYNWAINTGWMQFHNAVAMLRRWHNLLFSFQEKSSSFFEGDGLKLSVVEIIRQSDDRGFIQETPGRGRREDVKGERAGCCHETQPESHSMASWAETGTSALLTVTESTLSPVTLSLCDTTEWGAELTNALEEPFLSTIQVSCTEDLSRNSFSSQQKPS